MKKTHSVARPVVLGIGLVAGLLTSPLALAAGSQAEIQAAASAAAATLDRISSTDLANQIRVLHDKLAGYQWRTVYELTQVSKSPMPGTRLAAQAMPAMSQMDAELFLNSLPNVAQAGGIPAMNCPVAQMGGAAGRPMVVPVPGGQMTVTDDMIRQAMLGAAPDKGAQMFQTYSNFKNNLCQAIYNTGQLSFRIKKYQDLQANWQECSTNGIQISAWAVKEKFGFPGGIHRTVQAGGGLMFKCGAIYKGNVDDVIGYDSWFKWSDDSPVPMNLFQTIRGAGESPNACPKICVPVVGGGSLSASLCMGLDPGISAAGKTIPMRMGVKFRYRSRDKEFCTPVLNVPAPFGYAESLGEMADKGKQELAAQMQNQLLSVLPISGDAAGKIKQLTALMK